MRELDLAAAASALRRRDDLVLDGWSRRDIDDALRGGALVRVRRGWYCDGGTWRDLWPESQHRLHIAAVSSDAGAPPVFSFTSAAVLHGLPLYRLFVQRVHAVDAGVGRHSGPTVGHRDAVDDVDIVTVDGLPCTSLERTVSDLLRGASLEVAVAAADAAMQRVAGPPRRYDVAGGDAFRERLRERLRRSSGKRGVRAARDVVEVLDGRSELPLESVTKFRCGGWASCSPASR